MTETIVVGVKDADASRRAVDWATREAAARGATLVLAAVGDARPDPDAVPVAQILLDAELARLGETGIPTETRALHGDVADALAEAAEHATMLVIGTDHPHHHRGEHGRRIVSGAHCTVVVVPELADAARSGVVVGVDSSSTSDVAVAFAAAEAAARGERLIAIGAWMPMPLDDGYPLGGGVVDMMPMDLTDPTRAVVERALEPVRAAHPDLAIEMRIEQGDAALVLTEAAQSAELLVVGTHGRGAIARFFLGSVSDAVLREPVTVTAAVR